MESQRKISERIQVLTRILQYGRKHTKLQICQTSIQSENVSPSSISVEPPPQGLELEYKQLFTPGALQFVANLVNNFDKAVENLYWQRLNKKCHLKDPSQLPVIEQEAAGNWKVAPLPQRLLNRHLDLGDVSPSNIQHFTQALMADVQGIQVDFDDGHCPTWRNQIGGLYNVYQAAHNQIAGVPKINSAPVLMLRPRAWNMTEHNMMVNGKVVPGPLFDFGLLMYHNAHQLIRNESGPFFYLSKVEGASEAKLWDEIFSWTESQLNIKHGTIKACVLIENIFSSFELDDILFALKDHSLGLNCGIWDYAASIICKFGDSKQFLLPDRNKYVNMERHFLKSYMQLVVRSCHRRGAHATGGMAALLVPPGIDAGPVIDKVCKGKLQEIKEGVDGFMVYDVILVPHMNNLWEANAPPVNQLSLIRDELQVTGRDLLEMPSGGVTYAGLKHNIAVAILFIFNWFQGTGHFFHNGAVEDSATAEISRSQIWQWIRHQVVMEDFDSVVTKLLVGELADKFVEIHSVSLNNDGDRTKLRAAKQLFMGIVIKKDFPDFITTFLNDGQVFWSYQK